MSDCWNPNQYDLFKDERARPFFDLLSYVRTDNISTVIDLGCGTGELTRIVHESTKSNFTLGIDSSSSMLDKANCFSNKNIQFIEGNIAKFIPDQGFDLIFANASLQWVENHYQLFPKIFSWLNQQGQIAIQMPYNHDHIVHITAKEVALELFPNIFNDKIRPVNLLSLEEYATMFYKHGFKEQICEVKIYGQVMHSIDKIVDWTKGTLLTYYNKFLSKDDFLKFIEYYHNKLENRIGPGEYFYPFKRMILWAQ